MRSWIGYAVTALFTGSAMAGAIVWHYGETVTQAVAPEPKPAALAVAADPAPTGSVTPRAPAETGKTRRFPQSAFSPGEVTVPPPRVKTTALQFGDGGEALPTGTFAPPPAAPVRVSSRKAAPDDIGADAVPSRPATKGPTWTLVAPDVVDGRTLASGGRKVRLGGIALPPADKTCRLLDGRSESCRERAKTQLELFVRHRPVACSGEAKAEASCRIGSADVAEWLVRGGWVLAEDGAEPRLREAAAEAKRRRVGIWRS